MHLNRLLAQAPPIAGGKGATLEAGPSAVKSESGTALPAPGGPAAPGSSPLTMFLPIMLVFVLLIGMSWWTQSKEKKKRAALLSGLGRNDRVQTAGGMIGTIVEIKDDEVVLRVDEATNTKIAFSKGAIQGVLRKGRGGGGAGAEAESAPVGAAS